MTICYTVDAAVTETEKSKRIRGWVPAVYQGASTPTLTLSHTWHLPRSLQSALVTPSSLKSPSLPLCSPCTTPSPWFSYVLPSPWLTAWAKRLQNTQKHVYCPFVSHIHPRRSRSKPRNPSSSLLGPSVLDMSETDRVRCAFSWGPSHGVVTQESRCLGMPASTHSVPFTFSGSRIEPSGTRP